VSLERCCRGSQTETEAKRSRSPCPTLFGRGLTGRRWQRASPRCGGCGGELRTGRIPALPGGPPRSPPTGQQPLATDADASSISNGPWPPAWPASNDLPLARASVRQELLSPVSPLEGFRWRGNQPLRGQFQAVGDRFEQRLEGAGWKEPRSGDPDPAGPADSAEPSPHGPRAKRSP